MISAERYIDGGGGGRCELKIIKRNKKKWPLFLWFSVVLARNDLVRPGRGVRQYQAAARS